MNKPLIISILILFIPLSGCNKVSVNGNAISNSEINRIVASQEEIMGSKDQDAAIRQNVTQKLIDQALLLQEAKRQGVSVSEDEITQKYDDLINIWSNAEVQTSLKAQGYTDGNMKDKVRDQLLIDNLTKSLIQVSDQQLIDYYQSHLFLFSTYTILIDQASSEEAASILSKDSNKLKGDNVLFTQLPVQIQQTLREGKDIIGQAQINKLDASNYSVVIITKIISQPFDQVQDQVKDQLLQEQQIAKTQELINKLREEAKISIK